MGSGTVRAVVPVLDGVEALEAPLEGSVVTLGAFDGVHLGHQALIRAASKAARAHAVPAVGFTFHPHPARIFAPHRAPPLLMPLDERTRTMRAFGLDTVVVQPFDRAFAEVSADDFVADYLVAKLAPRAVVVGFNFSYGKGAKGRVEHLRAAGARHGFDVRVVEPVRVGDVVCSSTLVRERLSAGDVDGVAELLGRPHRIRGEVVAGEARGRVLGFPTANVATDAELLPEAGVYATWARIEDEAEWRPSVTNIGRRPTFDGGDVSVEAHLLDFAGDLYGRTLHVELVARLRDERRFDGLEALKAQLARDVEAARRRLEGARAAS